MKKISVGLPVYNGANYLAAAIESILGQTYPDFELVISDNASSDGTADICQAYARRDGRIRYIRQPRAFTDRNTETFEGGNQLRIDFVHGIELRLRRGIIISGLVNWPRRIR